MSEQPEAPHRRFELTLKIGADSWEDLLFDLRESARHIAEHGPQCNSVCGGPSTGHIITVEERPEMTHDRYFEEQEKYLEAVRKAKECPICGSSEPHLHPRTAPGEDESMVVEEETFPEEPVLPKLKYTNGEEVPCAYDDARLAGFCAVAQQWRLEPCEHVKAERSR